MGQNVIELNGKRYDAITGAFLGSSVSSAHHTARPHNKGKVIDGFIRQGHTETHTKKTVAKAAPAPSPAKRTSHPVTTKLAAKPTNKRLSAATPKIIVAHKPQRAKTLMRRTVQKPKPTPKPAIKTQHATEFMAKPASAIASKRSAYQIDRHRLERAKTVTKHDAIKHFHHGRAGVDHAVQPSISGVSVPVITVRPAPAHHELPPRAAHHPETDIFEAAIAHATSHRQPAHTHHARRTRRRLINIIAGVSAFLIIGGFVAYLNMPHLALRVASIQAGFHATMPDYRPTGYALKGGVKRSGSTINLSFHSGENNYTITQQTSDWNSQTLLDNTLALRGNHTTTQKNGQTIYIYNNGESASWVNGGIRYDLTGNTTLSPEEITAIATSM
ncbi:MAG TPA: DUF4367 domain-containing protein [Candidatus Saccharimonadales bacterium]|nr:DUF4367 domain-containing protein [Candidatus Saccharimonadales bacterium]